MYAYLAVGHCGWIVFGECWIFYIFFLSPPASFFLSFVLSPFACVIQSVIRCVYNHWKSEIWCEQWFFFLSLFLSILIRQHQSTRLNNAEVTYFIAFIYRLVYGRIIAIPKLYLCFRVDFFSTIKLVWTCQSTYFTFHFILSLRTIVTLVVSLTRSCVWIFQPHCVVVFILSTISNWLHVSVNTAGEKCVSVRTCKSSCP